MRKSISHATAVMAGTASVVSGLKATCKDGGAGWAHSLFPPSPGGLMSTPVSHHPLAPLGSRRLIWLLVAGLAVAGVTLALVLSLSGSNSPYPVHAVPAAAVGSPAPGA